MVEKGSYFTGNIIEVIGYNDVLTSAQVSELEAYFFEKYGIVFE